MGAGRPARNCWEGHPSGAILRGVDPRSPPASSPSWRPGMQLDVPRPARPGPFGRRGAPGPPAVTAAVAAAVVLAAMIAASLTVLARPAGRSPAAARWAAGPRPATTEDPRAVAAGESRVHRRGRPPATTAGGGTPAPDATDPPAPAATPAGGTGAGAGALPAAPAGTAALPGALRDALASGDVLVVAPD